MISPRYKAFVEEYLSNGYNARQAYLKIVGSEGITLKSADTLSARILGLVVVKDYIEKREKEMREHTNLKREDIIERLNKRSLLVQEISDLAMKDDITEKEKEKLKRLMKIIKASDANKSDEILNRMLGWNEPDKQSIEHTGIPPLFPDISYDKDDNDNDE